MLGFKKPKIEIPSEKKLIRLKKDKQLQKEQKEDEIISTKREVIAMIDFCLQNGNSYLQVLDNYNKQDQIPVNYTDFNCLPENKELFIKVVRKLLNNNVILLEFTTGWCPIILDIIDCKNVNFLVDNVFRFTYSYLEPLCLSEVREMRDIYKFKQDYMARYRLQHLISLTLKENKESCMLDFLVNSSIHHPQILKNIEYFLNKIETVSLMDRELKSLHQHSLFYDPFNRYTYAQDVVDINKKIDTRDL